MALLADLSDVFRHLYDRLRISQSTSQGILPTGVLEQIRLVYQVNDLVDENVSGTSLVVEGASGGTGSIVATGWQTLHTVPPGVNWELLSIYLQLLTGTMTFDRIAVAPTLAGADHPVALLGSVTEGLWEAKTPTIIPSSARIRAEIDTWSVAGILGYWILYRSITT